MKKRTNIYPKNFRDACLSMFLYLILPLIYYFELWIVLPKFYQQWSLLYLFHFIMGNFIMFNICSNLIAVILCETSLRGVILPAEGGKNWRFCSICETLAPPRSWHCKTCNTCILKRDHHCMFAGCCIGHYNHRFFVVFLFYIHLATVYASYYNVYFIYPYLELDSWINILKIVLPLPALILNWSRIHLYVAYVYIVLIGGCLSGFLLYFHVNLILKNILTHAYTDVYDQGMLENTKVVFGRKWYLIWISPFVQSQLTCDGVRWDGKELKVT